MTTEIWMDLTGTSLLDWVLEQGEAFSCVKQESGESHVTGAQDRGAGLNA